MRKTFTKLCNCPPFQVIGQLERGTVISKFYARKRPERKMLAVRRETMLVVWYRVSSSRNMYEVTKSDIRLKNVKQTNVG